MTGMVPDTPPVGLVYVAPVGSYPVIGDDGSVTWLRPDGVENAQPIGYTFNGPTENGETE